MKLFLNEILCKLSLKIHIVAKRNTCFCSNNCWINMNLSTCVKFGGVCPKNNYHILKSHVNVLNNLGFFNFILQNTFFFVWHALYTPFTCGKGCLRFSNFEKLFEFIKTSNSTLLNCESIFNVGNKFLLDFFFVIIIFFWKESFVHSFVKLTHLT